MTETLRTIINGVEHIEEWKGIPDYENSYQASTFGRIKSLDRMVRYTPTSEALRFGKIISFRYDKDGYKRVGLYKDGKNKQFGIHQLVCRTFHENPENKPQVNHKDGIKQNNYKWNLEWSTNSENRIHAFKIGLSKPNLAMLGRIGKLCPTSKPILQLSLSGVVISEFEGGMDAMRRTGVNNKNISAVCLGSRNEAGGFKWMYKTDYYGKQTRHTII